MKKREFLLIVIATSILCFILSGCMLNDDYHSHHLEYNFDTNILVVDDLPSEEILHAISPGNVGITFYISEPIDNFTWHFNVLNDFGVSYEPTIDGSVVYIPHDFNKHPQEIFKATTYLMETHYHFIVNLD